MPLRDPEGAYREFKVALSPGETFSEHHVKVRAADISRYVLMPGSHSRGRAMAEQLADARLVGATRGYYIYTGTYRGTRLTVCSTGMGGPAVAIAMEELGRLGADTFVRVGSSGAWQPRVHVGDLVVVTATARFAGTARAYLPVEFPAIADHDVTAALLAAAARLDLPVHHGICAARDAFYVPWDAELFARLQKAGVLASEMEADTVFVVGSARGWRCGAALLVSGDLVAPLPANAAAIAEAAEARLVTLCLEAVSDFANAEADLGRTPLEDRAKTHAQS